MSRNLPDSQTIARYLVQPFSDLEMGATGALLIGDGDAPLGILILEVRPDANVDALDTILDGATTQVVPFLYKPGLAPTLTDEEVDLFCELVESPLVDIAISDCLCVWSMGHYLARSNHGRLACVGGGHQPMGIQRLGTRGLLGRTPPGHPARQALCRPQRSGTR